MASDRQIAANRANARKSTGPRTPEGKAASSTNALKSGIYAKAALIPGEEPAEFEAYRSEQYDHYAPVNPDERDLFDLMIKYKWQLRRLHDCYDQMWISYMENSLATNDRPDNTTLSATFIRANLYNPNLINLSRMIHSTDRAFHRTRTSLIHTQEKRQRAEAKAALSQPAQPQPTALTPFPAPRPATPIPSPEAAPAAAPIPSPEAAQAAEPSEIGFVPSKTILPDPQLQSPEFDPTLLR